VAPASGGSCPPPCPTAPATSLTFSFDHSNNSCEASHTVPWVSLIWIRIWIANPDPGESISNAKSKDVLYFKLLGLFWKVRVFSGGVLMSVLMA